MTWTVVFTRSWLFDRSKDVFICCPFLGFVERHLFKCFFMLDMKWCDSCVHQRQTEEYKSWIGFFVQKCKYLKKVPTVKFMEIPSWISKHQTTVKPSFSSDSIREDIRKTLKTIEWFLLCPPPVSRVHLTDTGHILGLFDLPVQNRVTVDKRHFVPRAFLLPLQRRQCAGLLGPMSPTDVDFRKSQWECKAARLQRDVLFDSTLMI